MKHRRISRRRAVAAGAGAAALIAAGVTFQTANASEDSSGSAPRTLTAAKAGNLAQSLSQELGGKAAGSYYDASAKSLVVNVLDEGAKKAVETAGAKARVVENSLAELKSARSVLDAKAAVPGTSWAMDPAANKVVVTADRTVKGAELDKLTKVMKGLGGTVELKHSKGEFKPFVAGGDAIWGDGARCSLGFNVVKDGQPYFLTAGHCGNAVKSWSDKQGGSEIGTTEDSKFPGDDYALVKYTGQTDHPSEVNLYGGGNQKITKAADATVGEKVQRSGSTTQVHDGTVKALNATVNYQEGQVDGLIQTDVCAEPGDSGGALFDGESALGLTSGGSGDCSSGGETFFQPVPEALSAYGAKIG